MHALAPPLLLLLASLGLPAPSGLAPAPATAQERDPAKALASLREELVATYETLVEEAHDRKLYARRDALLEAILAVRSDHEEARKRLGYRWDRREETWKRGRYREPKDRASPEQAEEFARLRADVSERLRERLLEILWGPGMTREAREREAALYLPLVPEDPYLRRALGQVAGGEEGVWLSEDAVRTRERRAELAALVERAKAAVPELRPWDVDATTRDLALPWGEAWQTGRVKATGTVQADEIEQAVATVHMLGDLLPEILPAGRSVQTIGRGNLVRRVDPEPELLGRATIYLLQGPTEARVLMQGFPEITPEQRELYPLLATAALDTFNSIGVWDRVRERRLDALTRQIVGNYLRDHYGVSTRHGWIWEGLGLYLTHLAVGTRLTYFVRPSNYVEGGDAPRLGARLMAPNADWLAILLEEMQKQGPPRLVYAVGKDVNSLTIRELLLAHGLAAYLVELRPEALPSILKFTGGGANPIEVLEGELGRRMPDLERDVVEWAHMAIRLRR